MALIFHWRYGWPKDKSDLVRIEIDTDRKFSVKDLKYFAFEGLQAHIAANLKSKVRLSLVRKI